MKSTANIPRRCTRIEQFVVIKSSNIDTARNEINYDTPSGRYWMAGLKNICDKNCCLPTSFASIYSSWVSWRRSWAVVDEMLCGSFQVSTLGGVIIKLPWRIIHDLSYFALLELLNENIYDVDDLHKLNEKDSWRRSQFPVSRSMSDCVLTTRLSSLLNAVRLSDVCSNSMVDSRGNGLELNFTNALVCDASAYRLAVGFIDAANK